MDLAQRKAGAQFPSSNWPTLCRCHSELAGCAWSWTRRTWSSRVLFLKLMLMHQSCLSTARNHWFANAFFAKRLRLGFLAWFLNVLSTISILVIIGKCSLLCCYGWELRRVLSRCAVEVSVHTMNCTHRPCKSVLYHSCPSFLMVPEITRDLEIVLLCGSSLDAQMLVVISLSQIITACLALCMLFACNLLSSFVFVQFLPFLLSTWFFPCLWTSI